MSEAIRSSGIVTADAFGANYEAELRDGRDPWQSLRELRQALPDVELQAAISGAGLLRLQPVADDVVELFVKVAADSGVEVFRIHDPVNDVRNIRLGVQRVREAGRHVHGQLFYALGPPYTDDYWTGLAREFVELGCEALVVDDAGWQLEPRAAAELTERLRSAAGVPTVVSTAGSVSALHMLSGLRPNFLDADQDGSLASFFQEFAQVRADLGYPPLSPPIAGVIGAQAVLNATEGSRYRTVTHEIKEYLHGLYGRPPAEPDAELRRAVLGHDEPLSVRPAEVLEPEVAPARAELERLGVTPEPELVLSFCLFPDATRALLRQRSGKTGREDRPQEARAEADDQAGGAAPAGGEQSAASTRDTAPAQPATPAVATGGEFEVDVEGEVFRVRVSAVGATVTTGAPAATASSAAGPAAAGTPVVAPMQGLLVKINVGAGADVKLGDVVAVLEAMKMQNDIVSTVAGRVSAVAAKQGEVVAPNQPILFIQ